MSERQAKVYLTMLKMSGATASELQRAAEVPNSKIYAIVDFLVSNGYCRKRQIGNKCTYEAINPQTAMKSNIHHLESQMEKLHNLTNNLSEIYEKADQSENPGEFIEILYGKENTHRNYIQLIRNANKEILGFGRPPFAASTREKIEEQFQENYNFHARNGKARWVYEFNYPEQDLIIPGLLKGQEMGGRFRVAENLPLKMAIFDQRQVLIIKKSHLTLSDEMTNVLIKNSDITSAFCILFEFFWNQSMELDEWIKSHR